MHVESKLRKPLITGGKTIKDVSDDICIRVEESPSWMWYVAMIISNITLVVGAYAVYRTLWDGIGMWGLNKTVMWAWDITNFVWWVGIGVGAFSAIIHLPVKEKPLSERRLELV